MPYPKKDSLRHLPAILFGVTAGVLLFTRLDAAAQGVRDGLLLCAETVIPMLFPFMTLSGFLVLSGVSERIGRLLHPLTARLFHLPGVAAAGILMSFLGGYPVGAQNAARLRERGLIREEQAELMALICCCPGPTFAIGALGTSLFGSAASGGILYASCVLACLTVGCLFSRLYPRPEEKEEPGTAEKCSLAQAFVEGTAGASNGMFVICSWVILFAAILSILLQTELPEKLVALLAPLLEVTVGSRQAYASFGVWGVAAACGFGGLSVHCQIFSALPRLRLLRFFAARALCAVLTVMFCAGLFRLFPQAAPAFAASASPRAVLGTGNIGASLMLLLLSAVLVCTTTDARRPVDFTGEL